MRAGASQPASCVVVGAEGSWGGGHSRSWREWSAVARGSPRVWRTVRPANPVLHGIKRAARPLLALTHSSVHLLQLFYIFESKMRKPISSSVRVWEVRMNFTSIVYCCEFKVPFVSRSLVHVMNAFKFLRESYCRRLTIVLQPLHSQHLATPSRRPIRQALLAQDPLVTNLATAGSLALPRLAKYRTGRPAPPPATCTKRLRGHAPSTRRARQPTATPPDA